MTLNMLTGLSTPILTKSNIVLFSVVVVGAAALCLFPLWPDWMRILVYWCSLLGASFVGFMLFLIVRKYLIMNFLAELEASRAQLN